MAVKTTPVFMKCGCIAGGEHRRLIHNGIPAEKHLEFWNKRQDAKTSTCGLRICFIH